MQALLEKYLPNVVSDPQIFVDATIQTIYMTFWAAIFGGGLGLILGVILVVTRPGGLYENKTLFWILDKFVNLIRSIPFIILLALLAVITQFIVGTTIGAKAALVPLVATVIPFFARQVETALLEVDPGLIEAAQAMGLVVWESFVAFIYEKAWSG